MGINELPDELLALIFSHLDLKSRVVCELTCKRWKEVISSVSIPAIRLWSCEIIEGYMFEEYSLIPAKAFDLGYYNGDAYQVDTDVVVSFLKKHKSAKVLYLRTDALKLCLDTIEKEWLNLCDLQLCVDSLPPEDRLYIAGLKIARYITAIEFDCCFDFEEGSSPLDQFYASCPNLERLALGPLGVHHLPYLSDLPHLNSLSFRFPNSYESRFRDIRWIAANLRNLQELKLDSIDGEDLTMVCRLQRLVTLSFSFSSGQFLSSLLALSQLKNLRNLTLSCPKGDINVTLLQPLSNCTNLTKLTLDMRVTEALVKSLPSWVPQLEVLKLINEGNEEGMKVIPELSRITRLKTLQVRHCPLTPLIELIEKSSFLRDIIQPDLMDDQKALKLVHAMNLKAMSNENELFTLLLYIERDELRDVARNLKIYWYNVNEDLVFVS